MKNTFRAGQKVKIVNCYGFTGMTGKVVQVLHKSVQYPNAYGSRAYLVRLDIALSILGTWEDHFPVPQMYLEKVSKRI